MPLPIKNQALEQIGPAQERTVGGVEPAEHDVIAAAGSGVAAVDHELVGAEPAETGVIVERARDVDRLAPGRGRMDIDLDDAGIGRHLDDVQARVGRRLVALDMHRHVELGRGRFDDREQLEIVFEPFDRRHEHAQPAVARLDRQGGTHRNAGGARRRGHAADAPCAVRAPGTIGGAAASGAR